jgi:hypothetical protein
MGFLRKMTHFIFYIDDSGGKEYAISPELYSNSGNTRYFCFGGILIENNKGSVLASKLASCKKEFFGNDNVEIKSNWLRIPKECKRRYLDKYSISEEKLKDFVEYFYQILSDSEILMLAAVIDKVHMCEDYGGRAWYAPAISYEILMQRIVQQVVYPDTFSVIIDDMDGATPKGNQYKVNLKKQHQLLRKNGSRLKRGLDFRPLQSLKFIDSTKSHHIQVADIVAYNVFRQFIEYGEEWESNANIELPIYHWLAKLKDKFRNSNGRIQGYGIIKMPLRQRREWTM